MQQVVLGQADDLGGGIFKKRLGRNLYRSILLTKGRHFWVYTFLYAKKDRANITHAELVTFRSLAGLYAGKTTNDIAAELARGELLEICHESEAKVQERRI